MQKPQQYISKLNLAMHKKDTITWKSEFSQANKVGWNFLKNEFVSFITFREEENHARPHAYMKSPEQRSTHIYHKQSQKVRIELDKEHLQKLTATVTPNGQRWKLPL